MIGSSSNSVKFQLAGSAWDTIALPATPLFGTDGIRGRVGEILNAQLGLQLGFWAGQVLQSHTSEVATVILGQDSRNSSDMLAMALSAGLTAAGLDVWHLGLCPTGMVAYLTNTSEAIAGVMISASHNPPEDNGIKFFGSDGSKLADAVQGQIEAALRGNWQPVESKRWGQLYYRPDLNQQYLEFLQAPLQGQVNLAGTRIVLDLAWGAVVNFAATAFRALGAEVICLHDRADGDRINVNCGSTHLAPLQAAVLEHQADMGFAFDGDADRVMAVDDRGRIVDGDYILYFWGQALRQKQQLPGNIIVSTVMANLGFERAWERQGGRLIRTAVGDRHVYEEMIRQGAMLGGEQSGHILCRHYSISGDGLLSALHLAALVQQASTSFSELVDRSFQTYPQLLRNVRVEDRDRRLGWQNCEGVQQAIAQAQADLSERGRVLVRASGTEPLIRVMVEAVSHDLAHDWVEKLVAIIEEHLTGNG